MDWQLLPVAAIAAGAACYLGHSIYRSWRPGKGGCGGGCGCASQARHGAEEGSTTLIPSGELTVRLRESRKTAE